jgi:hypothetical protein
MRPVNCWAWGHGVHPGPPGAKPPLQVPTAQIVQLGPPLPVAQPPYPGLHVLQSATDVAPRVPDGVVVPAGQAEHATAPTTLLYFLGLMGLRQVKRDAHVCAA